MDVRNGARSLARSKPRCWCPTTTTASSWPAGTFPQLPDHPLHEAVYGLPNRPDYRRECGSTFALEGTVDQVDPLRIDVRRSEVELDEEAQSAWLVVDSRTRIEGFDREGIATL